MISKIGRPTDDPKQKTVKFRISDKDIQRLEYCVENTGLSKSETLRLGIKEVYEKLKCEKNNGNPTRQS